MSDESTGYALLTREGLVEALGWQELPTDEEINHAVVHLDEDTHAILVCHEGGVTLERAYTRRDGEPHGFEIIQHEDGHLFFSRVREGLEHGLCVQYYRGVAIGAYVMDEGTGTVVVHGEGGALHERDDRVDGELDGVEQRWSDDGVVYQESHYAGGRLHGIERSWNFHDPSLRDGFPRFYIEGARVDRETYAGACRNDPTLTPHRPEDDAPTREEPPRHPLDDVPTLEDVLRRLAPESLAR